MPPGTAAAQDPQYEEKPEEKPEFTKPPSTVSRITLDVDDISAELAAHLAATLVGHVLFLKNQVPFPVMQLYRIPGGKSTPRALKLRTELLEAVDTLSSHLGTTFSALSTAFARAGAAGSGPRPARRAYLAILVGPSIGSAKTRVMFAVDGLAVRIWGEREESEEDEDEDESEDDSESEGTSEEEESGGDSGSDSDSTGSNFDDADASSPPPSRSPSPSPCTSPVPSIPPIPPPPPPSTQQTLRAADRLLAHTLATAEHSMAAELAPSQTHILLRAPRRFAHPAWIPRQAASPALEGALRAFRDEVGVGVPGGDTHGQTQNGLKKKVKVEGAWVTCRRPGVDGDDGQEGEKGKGEEEEDEMIWWSWDGKIVGFADW
ncbi:hypothetical protein DFH06DRAFT_978230 [Mycena polygramma]|nr:hypothetical protein DFH06DRAFT_978230 [Mycena polygramma]